MTRFPDLRAAIDAQTSEDEKREAMERVEIEAAIQHLHAEVFQRTIPHLQETYPALRLELVAAAFSRLLADVLANIPDSDSRAAMVRATVEQLPLQVARRVTFQMRPEPGAKPS